ncbi:hypothetical protein [Bremerella sp.]|uniref:hypothetical protein n=1 Tax=Bremerella sp. TaxID=2795602 RepID=UPI00391A119F
MLILFRTSACLPILASLFVSGLMLETAYGQFDPRVEAEQQERREIERREERERDEFRRDMERQREELRREAERLSERVNDVRPRAGELEQRRRQEMEREHHRRMLEGHRLDFEMHKLHMERVATQARIANDPVLSAAFALERLPELVPNEKERREVLEDFLDAAKNPAVKRLIRMKMLELPVEGREREELIEVIESFIE